MSELNTKINELRTLKKSYSDLADVASNGAKESTLLAESESIKQAIAEAKPNVDLSGVAQETTLLEVKNAVENIDFTPIEDKIDNIKLPEIDTTELAKQGENQEATNTAIYNDTHNVAQHFGITAATEFTPMTIEEIESELITIWNNTFGE